MITPDSRVQQEVAAPIAGPHYEDPRHGHPSPAGRTVAAHRNGEASSGVSLLGPLVGVVANINASVHTKMLSGFVVGALLLLGMYVLGLVVIQRMNQRVEDLIHYHEQMDRSRQMMYAVTAQSHYRAMALLTNDDSWNTKINRAKGQFSEHLDVVQEMGYRDEGEHFHSPADGAEHFHLHTGEAEFFARVREADARFAVSSDKVLKLYQAGNIAEALRLHIDEEHEISHEVEDAMQLLIEDSSKLRREAMASFQSDKAFLTAMVGTFSGVSLGVAVLLGLVLSRAFIWPVRRIERVVAAIAGGDFTQRVKVPNRDEFGSLSSNVNLMSEQLANLYEELSLELTERKRAEERSNASLQEKEALLREIHHRVKNNLQVISSLLNLQCHRTQDDQALGALRDSQNRVQSMALIHQKLYNSQDLAVIDFAEYCRSLVVDLFDSYGVNTRAIALQINIEDVPLDIDTAIPCGLIVNELVSNSLKHAFPEGKEGEIRIELRPQSDNRFILTVSDNGVGLPLDCDFQNTPSLGLRLVNTLTRQMMGSIQLDRRGGTTFRLTFAAQKHMGAGQKNGKRTNLGH